MKHCFKIWNNNRQKKVLVLVDDNEGDVYENLVLKASLKLETNGSSVVLENDGTLVDETDALIAMKHETLMLLKNNDKWTPQEPQSLFDTSTTSLATTISAISPASSSRSEIIALSEVEDNADDSTTTNASPVIQVVNLNTEYLWSSFEIPWHKLPADMLINCENGLRDKYVILEAVHLVVNEMRTLKEEIPSKAFKIVAYKMINKYPAIFQDVDEDGIVMGDGSVTLKTKLQERYTYLRRPHKRAKQNVTEAASPANKKIRKNEVAGSTHWAPEERDCEPDVIENEKERLRDQHIPEDEMKKLMESTYAEQRGFINRQPPPSVEEIKSEWPVLFTERGISQHFELLTGTAINNLRQNIEEKCDKIIKFGIDKKLVCSENVAPKTLLMLKVLGQYFKEKVDEYLIIDAQSINNDLSSVATQEPFIAKFDSEYKIYFEKSEIITTENCLEALNCCVGLYFVFNLQYPTSVSTTLEFLQRYFLKIHPDSGTRSKKINASKKKVIGLMTKLRDL